MEYQTGDILEGTVSKITNFGAFISLPNGQSGLVHISEVSDNYVKDINDYLSVGQHVKVIVTNVEDDKIDLSIKRANPQEKSEETLVSGIDAKYQVGDVVEGTVTGIAKFGAFIDLPGGVRGLAHISEISDDYVKNINNYLSIGQKVKAMVIGLDKDKTSLSIKQADPDNQIKSAAAGTGLNKERFEQQLSKCLREGNINSQLSQDRLDRFC